MAKSKKQSASDPSETAQSPAKPAAKKPAAPAKKAAKPAGAGGMPSIDTSLAAQAAANMVASNRDRAGEAAAARPESASFKQLKQNVSKPAVHGPAGFLQNSSTQKKSNLPFGARKQVGHNQTFGADVNRSGVPRRTGG